MSDFSTRAVRATLVSCLTAATTLSAQTPQPTASRPPTDNGHAVAVPTAHAALRKGSIVIDGILNDTAWATAQPVTAFTQTDPEEGKPGSERTEFRFLIDDDA